MAFERLDNAAIARALSQVADRPGDQADVFFERRERVELPSESRDPGIRIWRETGLAVRLMRDGHSWLASRDGVDRELFRDALRRVARALPRASYPLPEIEADPWPEMSCASELLEFPAILRRAVASHGTPLSLHLTVRRHRRWVRVVGNRLSSGTEEERFYSLHVEAEWGRFGFLLSELDVATAERVGLNLVRAWNSRQAPSPHSARGVCVLGPGAAAVLLHEAVAHALETDTLALTGHPEAALGQRLGSVALDVFDDPATAPPGVRRTCDDEGFPVLRRCLLRAGVIEQPLCDSFGARASELLVPGAGRRGDRHSPPGPRSSHLELVPGELSAPELFADAEGGLYLPEAERGHLDPTSGEFVLRFRHGRRISGGVAEAPVGPCTLRGRISELLSKVVGVGRETRSAGAGWCAKGGVRLPVWASSPELRLEAVEIEP